MSRKQAEIERLRQKMSENEQKEELAGVSRRKLADSCFKAVAGCRFSKVKFLLDNGVSVAVKNDEGKLSAGVSSDESWTYCYAPVLLY